MDRLVPSLSGLAGRQVNDRTGLQGDYAFTLKFSPSRGPGTSQEAPNPDDAPDFFTALQEQLGLKLQPEKTMVTILVICTSSRPRGWKPCLTPTHSYAVARRTRPGASATLEVSQGLSRLGMTGLRTPFRITGALAACSRGSSNERLSVA
jgi:hypothetical protein